MTKSYNIHDIDYTKFMSWTAMRLKPMLTFDLVTPDSIKLYYTIVFRDASNYKTILKYTTIYL